MLSESESVSYGGQPGGDPGGLRALTAQNTRPQTQRCGHFCCLHRAPPHSLGGWINWQESLGGFQLQKRAGDGRESGETHVGVRTLV